MVGCRDAQVSSGGLELCGGGRSVAAASDGFVL